MTFDIETVNDKSGKSIGKGLGTKRIEKTLQRCREIWDNKVHIEVNFILGLPHDNVDTHISLRKWIINGLNKEWIHRSWIVPLSINPSLAKSDLDINYEKYGYSFSDFVNEGRTRYNSPEVKWVKNNFSFDEAKSQANKINSDVLELFERTKEVTKFSLPVIYSQNGYTELDDVYAGYDKFVENYRKNIDKYISKLLEY